MSKISEYETQAQERIDAQQASLGQLTVVPYSEIAEQSQYNECKGLLPQVNLMLRELDKDRKSLTKPLDEVKRGIMDRFKPMRERLEHYKETLNAMLVAWDRKAEEQAAREAEADREGADREAEALSKMGVDVRAETPGADAVPRAARTREHWSCEVECLAELVAAVARGDQPLELLQPNRASLNALAREQREALRIPGCKPKKSVSHF